MCILRKAVHHSLSDNLHICCSHKVPLNPGGHTQVVVLAMHVPPFTQKQAKWGGRSAWNDLHNESPAYTPYKAFCQFWCRELCRSQLQWCWAHFKFLR